MLKKTITYTDYDGRERTEDFLFNITRTELTEMELDTDGGLSNMIKTIIDAKEERQIMQVFKKFLFKAYGEKSPDGRRFQKSEEISKAFSETAAYDKLFTELTTDAKMAADFMNAIIESAGSTLSNNNQSNTASNVVAISSNANS